MPADEPSNISAPYTRKEKAEIPTSRLGRPKRNYYHQIADYICDIKGLKPTPLEKVYAAQDTSRTGERLFSRLTSPPDDDDDENQIKLLNFGNNDTEKSYFLFDFT
jgi:hypothetical protein